jgi:alpha-ketoglutarate-dependent sulfate ester dioxygenase
MVTPGIRGGTDDEGSMTVNIRNGMPEETYQTIEVKPLSIYIGAEIRGADLTKPLPVKTRDEIYAAFLKWKVVFFRGQHLDHAQHVAFSRQIGEPMIGHPVFGHEGEFPEVYSVAKHRTANLYQGATPATPWKGWHTDITAAYNPPMASILRGVIIPPYGGDTWWTSLAAAYRGLSEPMQAFCEGLWGIHKYSVPDGAKAVGEYDSTIKSRNMVTEHPLVTVHAETGEKILFLSPNFLKSIDGLSLRESQKILELLWEHMLRPEFTVRFKWEEGDVAMWDNRATAHLAPIDVWETDFERQLYRVTLVGKPLVGVHGQPSRSIEGLPIISAAEELAKAS